MVPDGDRRHGSESGRIINKKYLFKRHDYVMCEFVLRDHFRNDLPMNEFFGFRRSPRQHICQAFVALDLSIFSIAQSHL